MSHSISRRHLLAGASAWGLASLTSSAHATPGWPPQARPRSKATRALPPPRKLVLMVAAGGWDTTYVLDPKPGLSTIDAPSGTIREIGGLPIFIDPSRPTPTRFFEKHAQRCQIVNGIQTQSIVHSDCSKRLLTGTSSEANPDIGAIAAFEHGREMAAPYFVLGQTAYSGPYAAISTRAGTANQLGALLNPLAGFPVGDPGDPQLPFLPDSVESSLIRSYVQAGVARERAVRGQVGHNKRRLDDFADAVWRGEAVAEIGAVGKLDFTRDLMVQADLALEGLETGLCHAVQIELGGWDTHTGNAGQTQLNEAFYAGLEYLIDELSARPGETAGSRMIDETVVVALSEMGRTPKLNDAAGKDHWPVTSAIVIGAGVDGGRTVGGSSDRLGAIGVDLATGAVVEGGTQLAGANLAAGLLALVGVDPGRYLPQAEPLHALRA